MTTNPSKIINSSLIAVLKTQFDERFELGMQSQDPVGLELITRQMLFLQGEIGTKMETAPTSSISRLFNWSQEDTVDMNEVNEELLEKVRLIFEHVEFVNNATQLTGRATSLTTSSPKTTPPPIRTTTSTPVVTSTTSTTTTTTRGTRATSSATTQQAPVDVKDFATGFRNKFANCWANSLLSSFIVNIPSFRQAYETVANYYAVSGVSEDDRRCGVFLQNALVAYDLSLVVKEPVDPEVTQNVRLAFNHFFGRVDLETEAEIFSISERAHEDAWEAMQMIMGEQQAIHKTLQIPLPSLYCPLETKRHYRPTGEPTPGMERDDVNYTRIGNDNASCVNTFDYQIILEIQNMGHLSFNEQLANAFRSPAVQGSEPALHIRPDGQRQKFELIATSNQFTQGPDELFLVIKRFGRRETGAGFKITEPVQIRRIIPLPPEATQENTPIAYELDAFIVHSGGFGTGHYIGYKKLEGRWIETNDGKVEFVSEQEIDKILQGQRKADYTSYCHHYRRLPQSRQAQTLSVSQPAETIAVPTQPQPSQRPTGTNLNLEKYTKEKQSYEKILQGLQTYIQGILTGAEDTDLTKTINALENPILDTLHHTIWLNDNMPNIGDYGSTTLNANPKKMHEIQLPWLIASGGNLDTQLQAIATLKLAIANERLKALLLLGFIAKLDAPFTTNAELLIALKALPDEVQWALHGLVYQAHKVKFGAEAVSKHEYGRMELEKENANIRKVLTEARESVLNIYGKNIVEQLSTECQHKASRMQTRYEMLQLKAFQALLMTPSSEVSSEQLYQAFERLEIRKELKEKLYLLIWFANEKPDVPDFGSITFKANPRCILPMCQGFLAEHPLCEEKANILQQMIALLDRDSK